MENLSINEIWANLIKKLENEIGKDLCDMWLKPMKIISFEGGVFKIEIPSTVWLQPVKDRYEILITQYLTEITQTPFSIEYIFPVKEEDLPKQILPPSSSQKKSGASSSKSNFFDRLNNYYTFDTFIEGPSNRFAYKASEAVVKKMGERTNNPFVLFSAPGLGKTHLLHAIGNQITKENPSSKVLYVTGESFVSEYIESLPLKTTDYFRKKYRSLDCLLIDDIQFVVGKEKSEQEFFNIFNSLFDNKKQIVLTSDRMPNQLGLSERLSSRLLSGIIAEIKKPDLETKIAILRQKRDFNHFDVGDDVLAFIAEGVQASIRELEGCLYKLVSYCSIYNTPPTINIAKEVLADIINLEQEKYSISINSIKKAVTKNFNIRIEDLNSKKKSSSIAWPRQIAMYLATELTKSTISDIGREFNRDHTTVLHAKEKVKEEIERDPFFASHINKIISSLKAVDNI